MCPSRGLSQGRAAAVLRASESITRAHGYGIHFRSNWNAYDKADKEGGVCGIRGATGRTSRFICNERSTGSPVGADLDFRTHPIHGVRDCDSGVTNDDIFRACDAVAGTEWK